jgi:hypothetical protein
MHAEPIIITVRYAQGTYVARVRGIKKTASCVYDAGLAATALARKLELDASSLELAKGEGDYLEFTVKPLRRLPAQWRMMPDLPTIAMVEAGKLALEAGGTVDQVFAAMLEQAPCPEAWPPQGAQRVQPEAFRRSDVLWELDSSIQDLARQCEGEYRARYYAGAVGFLRGLHMMQVVGAEERNRWKLKILEAHLQAIAQCEAAGEVVSEEIKRREAFQLDNLRRIERVTEALNGGGES